MFCCSMSLFAWSYSGKNSGGIKFVKKGTSQKKLNKRAASDFIVRRLRTDSKRRLIPVNRKSFAQERPYVGDR